jgi:hypothetical protein
VSANTPSTTSSGAEVPPLRRSEMPIEVVLNTEQLCALIASEEEVNLEHYQVREVIAALDAYGLIVRTEP